MTQTPSPLDGWRGIFPSLPTLFSADEDVDLDAQRRVVRFALEARAHGLICFGLAGEVFRLTPSERLELLEAIVGETDGRVPVLAGVGTEAIHSSVALARAAEGLGADGVVVPPPLTGGSSRRELLRYFETIAGSVSVPVMIQDAPEHLAVEVGPEMIETLLSRCENVKLVKLELGSDHLGLWLDQFGDRLSVFGGNGGMYMLESLDEGVTGIAPGVDLVDQLVVAYEQWLNDEGELALESFLPLLPMLLFELQTIDHYNACAKYVLERRGVLATTRLRTPAYELDERGRRLLDRHLDRLGVATSEPAR